MRFSLISLATLVLHTSFLPSLPVVCAQSSKFPYEAVVEAAEAYARSGPGRRYYPTSKLKQGLKVTVHRHDPGGWYMIAPPADSFSWIRADYVKREAGTKGVLTADGIVVRVGSTFGDTRDVEQRRLSTGEEVSIVGEQSFSGPDDSKVRYYKIKPPSGEWRWIAGQDVIPTSEVAQQERATNPFEVPVDIQKNAAQQGTAEFPDDAEFADGPLSSEGDSGNAEESGNPFIPADTANAEPNQEPDFQPPIERTPQTETAGTQEAFPADNSPAGDLSTIRQKLAEVDTAYNQMIERELSSWDLDSIQNAYQQLRQSTDSPAIQHQIDLRLETIPAYQSRKQQYDEFIALVNRTNRRESELLASLKEMQTVKPVSKPSGTSGETAPPPPSDRTVPQPKFDGAGIIQRSATTFPNAPKYVLLAPDGRVLAYLHASESQIDLSQYLGRPMGIIGQRKYVAALQSDLIHVRGLKPVRLK